MVKCYILNCPSGRKSCKEKVSLFTAPKDEILLEKWRHVIPQQVSRVFQSTDRICEKHFEKKFVVSRYQPSGNGDFFVDNFRSKLSPKAIPSIFPEVDQNDPRIEKYVPDPKPPVMMDKGPKMDKVLQSEEDYIYVDVEVSDLDYVPICFKCLNGSCQFHPLDFH